MATSGVTRRAPLSTPSRVTFRVTVAHTFEYHAHDPLLSSGRPVDLHRRPFRYGLPAMSTQPKLTGDRCKCSACDLRFKSTSAFDAHRRGSGNQRRCLTRAELASRGYSPNYHGFIRKENAREDLHQVRRSQVPH
jgi:hypothetical protein